MMIMLPSMRGPKYHASACQHELKQKTPSGGVEFVFGSRARLSVLRRRRCSADNPTSFRLGFLMRRRQRNARCVLINVLTQDSSLARLLSAGPFETGLDSRFNWAY